VWAEIEIPKNSPIPPVRLENKIINSDEYKNIRFNYLDD
jgi:hypothetical protein